jgi:polysaccharide export outer membrane protein
LIPWSAYHQGEYIGPARNPHLGEYRLRVDDQVNFVYRLTRERTSRPYQLVVGDVVRLELLRDPTINRELEVQPDGSVVVPLLGRVLAADRTTEQLRRDLEEKFKEQYRDPIVVVSPIKVNSRLEDLRAAVDRRAGTGGQAQPTQVTPEGTIQLPGIGSVCVQGLTLPEIKEEVDARYDQLFGGIEVTPILIQRAPRYIYVLGEVATPGRFTLEGPTSLMQSIALAGGWNNGANLRQVVVFRRAEDWRMTATVLNIERALYGGDPAPRNEVWLRDSDVVVVPKTTLRVLDDAIELAFTDGLYGIFPTFQLGFGSLRRFSAVVAR